MLSFKSFLTESMNEPYHFERTEKKHDFMGDYHTYSFTTKKGNVIHTNVDHYKDGDIGITFHRDTEKYSPAKEKYGKTNAEGSEAIRVFSTLKHIIHHHLRHHNKWHRIVFTAERNEPSRVKLYKHILKDVPHERRPTTKAIEFVIHRQS